MYVTMVNRNAAVCIYAVHEGLLFKKICELVHHASIYNSLNIHAQLHVSHEAGHGRIQRGEMGSGPLGKTHVATCFLRNTSVK